MKLLATIATLFLMGCSDHPEGWEFAAYAPKNATPQDLLEISNALTSNGYKRIRISVIDFGRATLISATKKERGEK